MTSPHAKAALRSLVLICIAGALQIAACQQPERTPSPSSQYTFTSGYITDYAASTGPFAYYATMVRNSDRQPWLIVAKTKEAVSDGFTTQWSSSSDAVAVDGTEYSPVPGHCIVVRNDGEELQQVVVDLHSSQTLKKLADGFGSVSVEEFDSLFPDP